VRADLGIATDATLIFSLSRLTFAKRVDTLLKAFALACRKIPKAFLLIAGTGPEEKALRDLTKELGMTSQVMFVGFIADASLWDYYAACDVFASPAWADFNIAPYEALSFGKKVVCSSEMEIDPAIAASGLVFAGKPTAEDFADAMVAAIKQVNVTSASLEEYTWDNKFSRMISAVGNASGDF